MRTPVTADIDLGFYDKFYEPGAYLKPHATSWSNSTHVLNKTQRSQPFFT